MPRPPPVDGARWFKAALARRLAARGADEATLQRQLAHHPLGRSLERKLVHPEVGVADGTPEPGEPALFEALAREPDGAARWRALFLDDPAPIRSLLGDDAGLPPEVAPSRWVGPGGAWSAVAAPELDPVLDALAERSGARWAVVRGGEPEAGAPDVATALSLRGTVWSYGTPLEDPAWAASWQALATGIAAVRGQAVPPVAWDLADTLVHTLVRLAWAQTVAAVDAWLTEQAPPEAPEARLVVVGTGPAVPAILEALALDMDLRDRVLAVVSVGGWVYGRQGHAGPLSPRTRIDWMGAWFKHEHLDTEVVRRIPYLSLGWTAPGADGVDGLDLASQRFGVPGFVGGSFLQAREPETVEPFDLGVLPVGEGLDGGPVAEALVLLADALVTSRR